jgi:hypothetical protein
MTSTHTTDEVGMRATVLDVTLYKSGTKSRIIYNGISAAELNAKIILTFPQDSDHVISSEVERRVVTRFVEMSVFHGKTEVSDYIRCVFIYTPGATRVYGEGKKLKFIYTGKAGEKGQMKVGRK